MVWRIRISEEQGYGESRGYLGAVTEVRYGSSRSHFGAGTCNWACGLHHHIICPPCLSTHCAPDTALGPFKFSLGDHSRTPQTGGLIDNKTFVSGQF